MNRLRHAIAAVLVLPAALLAAGSALAASGAEIKAAIAGNTVQGSMLGTGAYAEFYAPDGAIKGKDYTGKWSVKGDSMCFQYGADPESCWGVAITGSSVTWLKDGKEDGTGTIVPGNPNNF